MPVGEGPRHLSDHWPGTSRAMPRPHPRPPPSRPSTQRREGGGGIRALWGPSLPGSSLPTAPLCFPQASGTWWAGKDHPVLVPRRGRPSCWPGGGVGGSSLGVPGHSLPPRCQQHAAPTCGRRSDWPLCSAPGTGARRLTSPPEAPPWRRSPRSGGGAHGRGGPEAGGGAAGPTARVVCGSRVSGTVEDGDGTRGLVCPPDLPRRPPGWTHVPEAAGGPPRGRGHPGPRLWPGLAALPGTLVPADGPCASLQAPPPPRHASGSPRLLRSWESSSQPPVLRAPPPGQPQGRGPGIQDPPPSSGKAPKPWVAQSRPG